MTKAVKSVTSERGRAPRTSTMIAFGGAGPLYSSAMAETLDVPVVVIPMHPGLFCSLGLLLGDIQRDATRAWDSGFESVGSAFDEMEVELRSAYEASGLGGELVMSRIVSMRYREQRFELEIEAPNGLFDAAVAAEVVQRFHDEHRVTYGRSGSDELVEVSALRLVATNPTRGKLPNPPNTAGAHPPERRRQCFFGEWVNTPVIARAQLDAARAGPLIIEEMDTTVLVPPGHSCILDQLGNITITTGAPS
jgi:N-methylhydantoinase A